MRGNLAEYKPVRLPTHYSSDFLGITYVDRKSQNVVQDSDKDCSVIGGALRLLQVRWGLLARTKYRAHRDLLHRIRTLSVPQGPSSPKRFLALLGDDFP